MSVDGMLRQAQPCGMSADTCSGMARSVRNRSGAPAVSRRQRGVAIVLAMGIVTLATLTAVGLLVTQSGWSRQVELLNAHRQSRMMLDAGLDWARAILNDDRRGGNVDHLRAEYRQRLAALKDRYPTVIAEVRGEGLLIGLKAVVPNGELSDAARKEKLLTVGAGDNVVRFVPPLIITEADVDQALAILEAALAEVAK